MGLSHTHVPPPLVGGCRGAGLPPRSKTASLVHGHTTLNALDLVKDSFVLRPHGEGTVQPRNTLTSFQLILWHVQQTLPATLPPLLGPVLLFLPWQSLLRCLFLAKEAATPEKSVSKCLLTPSLSDDTQDPLPSFSQTLSCQGLWQVNLYSLSQREKPLS